MSRNPVRIHRIARVITEIFAPAVLVTLVLATSPFTLPEVTAAQAAEHDVTIEVHGGFARPPKPLVRRHPLIEFLQSPSNRTGCDAGRPRHGGDPAMAQHLDVARGKQAARTLIQSRPQHLVLAPYGFLINHATETTAASQKLSTRSCPYSTRLFCGVSLVQTLKVNQARIRRILVRSEELIR